MDGGFSPRLSIASRDSAWNEHLGRVFLMNFAGNLSSDYFILVTSYWGLYNFFTEGF